MPKVDEANGGYREQLLDAALELFAENGFAGTSIRDIAKRAGKSLSNVYHHFENKETLWLAILEHSINGLPRKLRVVADSDEKPLDRFVHLLKTHMRNSLEYHRESKIFFIDEERLSPRGKEINRQTQNEILSIYVEQLKILQSHGFIKTKKIKILAFNILGVLNWHLRWFDPEGDSSAEEVHDELISFILNGMIGPPNGK